MLQSRKWKGGGGLVNHTAFSHHRMEGWAFMFAHHLIIFSSVLAVYPCVDMLEAGPVFMTALSFTLQISFQLLLLKAGPFTAISADQNPLCLLFVRLGIKPRVLPIPSTCSATCRTLGLPYAFANSP